MSAPCSPSNLSSVTLVGSTGSDSNDNCQQDAQQSPTPTSTPVCKTAPEQVSSKPEVQFTYTTPPQSITKVSVVTTSTTTSAKTEATAPKDVRSPLKIPERKTKRRVSDGRGKAEGECLTVFM